MVNSFLDLIYLSLNGNFKDAYVWISIIQPCIKILMDKSINEPYVIDMLYTIIDRVVKVRSLQNIKNNITNKSNSKDTYLVPLLLLICIILEDISPNLFLPNEYCYALVSKILLNCMHLYLMLSADKSIPPPCYPRKRQLDVNIMKEDTCVELLNWDIQLDLILYFFYDFEIKLWDFNSSNYSFTKPKTINDLEAQYKTLKSNYVKLASKPLCKVRSREILNYMCVLYSVYFHNITNMSENKTIHMKLNNKIYPTKKERPLAKSIINNINTTDMYKNNFTMNLDEYTDAQTYISTKNAIEAKYENLEAIYSNKAEKLSHIFGDKTIIKNIQNHISSTDTSILKDIENRKVKPINITRKMIYNLVNSKT